jgi:dTDP-glucose 4,6-dehydratase
VNDTLGLEAKMLVLSRNPEAFAAKAPHLYKNPAISFVKGDVRTFTAAEVHSQLRSTQPRKFKFVIHAATEASAKLNEEDPLLMIDTIVAGTRATLNFAVESAAQRFLLTSSGAVYGPQPKEMTHIAEDYAGAPDCSDPNAAYGEGKRLAELLCACFHKQHGLETLIARCFAFVGPFLPLDAHFAIGNFIRDSLGGGPIQVSGDGTPYRSYLYSADAAIWLWTILLKASPNRPFNVGSEDARTIQALAEVVAEVCGVGKVAIKKKADPNIPPSRYIPSCQRAHEELGLRQHIDLVDAIRRTVAAAANKDVNG